MATASDISWGKYKSYEGVFYRGTKKYTLPPNPTEAEQIMAVITATEGGRFDAYNGYDVCICTSGLIQWCERGQYSVSDMLGKVADSNPELMQRVDAVALNTGMEFGKNKRGRYRFFFQDERGEVDRKSEQREQFLLHSSGKKGTWDDESRAHAKNWAAAISTVWEHPTAQKIQLQYTADRLPGFCLKYAKDMVKNAPATDVGMAFKAAYLSFAANNPTWANRHLKIAVQTTGGNPWTKDWLVSILKELTFGPNVTIYPHRYNAIRPVLENLYGLDLPDFSDELKQWKTVQPHEFFYNTAEVQNGLIRLGFDLGPWGADGKWGQKTTDALLTFEQLQYGEKNVVPPEHIDGMLDNYSALKLEEVLNMRQICLP